MSDLNWRLSEFRTSIELDIPANAPNPIRMDSFQAEAMIDKLGELRAAMQPPRPTDTHPPLGYSIPTAQVYRWLAIPTPEKKLVLAFHDPKFGWNGYSFQLEEMREMIALLGQAVAAAESGQT